MPILLHVGCGPARKHHLAAGFHAPEWSELRLDIDPSNAPDFVATMTDMRCVADASIDAIYSSHNLEHLYPHEVPVALAEFMRVLVPGGFAVILCPDLQSVAALVAQDRLTETAYVSPAGPIAPLDILYGHRPSLVRGNLFMAHRAASPRTRWWPHSTRPDSPPSAAGVAVRLTSSSRWSRAASRSPPRRCRRFRRATCRNEESC